MMREVQRRISMTAEHGGGAHELGGGHPVQVRVVAAHRVRQRVGTHPSHTHAGPETVGSAVDPWREESSDAGTLLL